MGQLNLSEREVLIGWCTSLKVELFQIIPFFICHFWKFCVSASPEKISYYYYSFELNRKIVFTFVAKVLTNTLLLLSC